MDVARISYSGALGGAGELDLPDHGVVLVVGPNKSGKSSFVEAVAVAAWGRTLRDARPWREGEAAHFELVERTGLSVQRSRSKGGSQKLRFARTDLDEQTAIYETTAKAQAALDAQVGPFDLWRRANVFAGADAAHLSLATDGERKRLLEAMLGLEAFDCALLACKADAAVAQQEEGKLDGELRDARWVLERAEEALVRCEGELAAEDASRILVAPGALGEELTALWGLGGVSAASAAVAERVQALSEAVTSIEAEAVEWQIAAHHLLTRVAALEARARVEAARAHRLEGGSCPECDQDVPPATAVALREEAARLLGRAARLRERARACDAEHAEARSQAREVVARRQDLRDRGHEALCALQAYDESAGRRQHLEELKRERYSDRSARQRRVADATKAHGAAASHLAQLRAVAEVLGLKGPRTTVLAGALDGITAGANAWLRRLGGGIQIELRPYTETRSGGTTGAIEIKVRGAGGGEGYKACSSGERRRIDVALLFSLGEVASAARGGRKSTMWCDEVLTHLDEDGIAGAVEAIREVARERCVVVIEQEKNIAVDMLRPDRVVRLKKG